MMLPFFFLFLGIQPPVQQSDGRVLQALDQQQRQVERLQQDVQKLSSELDKTHALLQNELKPSCSAEIQWLTPNLKITNVVAPLKANVFSVVSAPDACLPAEIRFTTTYFDPADNFVCSGAVAISQSARTQSLSLEFRPYEIEVFAKWWDGPTLRQQGMTCHDLQGIELRNPTQYATSMRIYATVFPKRGGLATSEVRLPLPRAPQQ